MKLIYEATGNEVKVGDLAKTFRDDDVVVTGFSEPHKPSSTGRVYVKYVISGHESGYSSEYFPGVIGAKWVEA